MDREPGFRAARWGGPVAAMGLLLIAVWGVLEFAPLGALEEPASPGKTPNPSTSQPIPAWEYSLARMLSVLTQDVLPLAGILTFASGVALLIAGIGPGSLRGVARSLVGALFLVGGLSLLGITAWQWHVRTAPIEPPAVGRTPEPDPDSPFFQDFSRWTPEKLDAFRARRRREDRLDRLWARSCLYLFPPAGVLLAMAGVWLLGTRPPRREGPDEAVRPG